MDKTITPGWRVQTLGGELDTDPEGGDRTTPAGSWGCVESAAHVDDDGTQNWNIGFPNGAWIILSEPELRDSKQYALAGPRSLREHCLRLRYGYDVQDLSSFDVDMVDSLDGLTGHLDEILSLIDRVDALR